MVCADKQQHLQLERLWKHQLLKYRPALLIGKIYCVINMPPCPPPTKRHLKKKTWQRPPGETGKGRTSWQMVSSSIRGKSIYQKVVRAGGGGEQKVAGPRQEPRVMSSGPLSGQKWATGGGEQKASMSPRVHHGQWLRTERAGGAWVPWVAGHRRTWQSSRFHHLTNIYWFLTSYFVWPVAVGKGKQHWWMLRKNRAVFGWRHWGYVG